MSKDVAIIGASTAGLFAAHLLASRGQNVRIFEAEERIDPAPRTLIVTNRFRHLTGPLSDEVVINKIFRFELFADGKVASFDLRNPDLVIERSKLIQALADKAEASGAQVLTNHRFLNFKPNGTRLTFTASNGNGRAIEDSTNVLIGADGAFSRVAQCGGWPKPPIVFLLQAVVKLPKDIAPDTTRVWFLPEDTRYFYWLIPQSATQGVLGLIAENNDKGRRCLERFIEKKGLVPDGFQSAPIPVYDTKCPVRKRFSGGEVYLAGDAARQVKATTVGGVVTGLKGALGVAEAILNGGTARELASLRRELGLHGLVRKILHDFSQSDYVKLLDLLTPSSKRLLGNVTRDETEKLLLRLIFKQPRLLLLGLRSLLTGRIA